MDVGWLYEEMDVSAAYKKSRKNFQRKSGKKKIRHIVVIHSSIRRMKALHSWMGRRKGLRKRASK